MRQLCFLSFTIQTFLNQSASEYMTGRNNSSNSVHLSHCLFSSCHPSLLYFSCIVIPKRLPCMWLTTHKIHFGKITKMYLQSALSGFVYMNIPIVWQSNYLQTLESYTGSIQLNILLYLFIYSLAFFTSVLFHLSIWFPIRPCDMFTN